MPFRSRTLRFAARLPIVSLVSKLSPDVVARPSGLAVTLASELDDLENHQGHDVDAILVRAAEAAWAAEALGDLVLLRRAQLVQADMRQRNGSVGAAARIFLTIHAWADRYDCRPLSARSHFHLALTYHYLGDHAASLEHSLSSVELLEDTAPAGLRIIYLVRLANSLAECGSIHAARERYEQAEQLAVASGDLTRRMLVLNNLAYTEIEAGHTGVAQQIAERMHATVRALGREFLVIERDTIANVRISVGDFAGAERILADIQDAPRWFEAHDVADARLTLATAQRRLGALDRAQASLDRCRAACTSDDQGPARVRAMAEQAELYAAGGEYAAAFEEYKRFHAAAEDLRSQQQEARARTRQAIFETAEARRDAERYREQARRDPLTGLYNRRFVDERLPQIMSAAAAAGTPLTVALVDLDHFKRINDTLSHDVGDRVLVAVADLLAGALPGRDTDAFAARMGGEEFLVVLPGLAPADARPWLESLRHAVRDHPWSPVTGELPVTVSIGGVAVVPAPDEDQAALLAEADRHLYVAKRTGRDRVVC
ncbi:diguanylate cyclase (GGDEF)-like protein [Pseudosporangium ferrugineum]|uniref:Diguanylate cyclase (GGDEF)-like protein n=1 Tax=Pseudosporangium ferrugineum TaxID=439699 RepID=A0A2T0SII6_9ACTN|nr:diguanylate cyclase (GGDEF)-like protein [Pseudosporangium ferrugineum]